MRRRGYSVLELVVALGLALLASGLLIGFFVNSLRLTAKETALLELEQSCHFVLQKLERDVQSSGVTGISYLPAQADGIIGLAINPLEDVTPDGQVAWMNRQLFYAWQPTETTLYKFKDESASSELLSQPLRFGPSELHALITARLGGASAVGQGVVDFSVSNQSTDGSNRLVQVTVEMERDVPQTGERRFKLSKLIALRN